MTNDKPIMILNSLISSIRRRYLYYFKREYVNNQIRLRKGECGDCNICCVRTRNRCPFLKDGKCKIYEKMPKFCKIFPIDERDIELAGVKDVCKYKW